MKYLLSLTFLCSFFVFSQSELLLPNGSGYWDVKAWTWDHESPGGGQIPYYSGYYQIYSSSDSIFDEEKYWYQITDEIGGEFLGRIAADSGKIYFKSYSDHYPIDDVGTETIVLYDFNKTTGDTAYFDGVNYITVVSVETSMLLGEERLTLVLSDEDQWISGMGSTSGFFQPLIGLCECRYVMCSYAGEFVDSLGEYFYLSYDEPSLYPCVIGIEENEQASQIDFYPNPASAILSINYEGASQDYSILDITGKVCLNGQLNNGLNLINVDKLKQGVYFLTVSGNTEVLLIE